MQHAIECKNLFKRYESGAKAVDAVNGLDLEVGVGRNVRPRPTCYSKAPLKSGGTLINPCVKGH